MHFGIDSFCEQIKKYKNCKFGFVTNNAAKTTDGLLSRVALIQSEYKIQKLFSPEHGLSTKGVDGIYQHNHIDSLTNIPVVSLYSDHLIPSEDELADIDIMLFDIPDVGCRFYTYLWTMTYVMEACALYKKPLIILDRPNPISGNIKKAEGPMLDVANCSSFIGRWDIPVRHSCTLGELAMYFSSSQRIDVDLTVIKVRKWNRNQLPGKNNWPFTPTSPAINTIETALCYPGTGLLEGININEGRGTNKPFTIFGAPWINADLLLRRIQEQALSGVAFKPVEYIPSDSLYSNKKCFGLSIAVTDEKTFLPVHTGITIIQQLLLNFPEQCIERLYKTVANPIGERHLDKLLGIANSFQKLKKGDTFQTSLNTLWEKNINSYLLYH